MKYNREGLLDDKEKYYKGWPKESMVSYYDQERKKVKELIPVEYGEREGNYFMFHDNGLLAVQGEYRFNYRVGDWIENYPNGKRKKLISYGKDPFDKGLQTIYPQGMG
jgi:antitoxin component YwqK of YwqJK toxin-antitoxin module